MSEKPIYDFGKFKAALEGLGFTIGEATPYVPLDIADVNLTNIQNGEVEITDEGIFYINPVSRSRHQIFLYKKSMYLEYNGEKKTPKMHVVNCEAIQNFGREQYRRANTGTVLVWDKSSHQEVSVSNLPLCNYCRNMMAVQNTPTTSDDFEAILREAAEKAKEAEQETDLSGYLWNWEKCSEGYRRQKDYTCERCGFKATTMFGRKNMHVHHRDGNKLNNTTENFECLCIACHAEVDSRHKENFSKGANKKSLDAFKKKYPEAGPKKKPADDKDLPF